MAQHTVATDEVYINGFTDPSWKLVVKIDMLFYSSHI